MAIDVGYDGGKTIFDDLVRELRPRFLVRRTFQRTIYRPGELVQCDLWEPRQPIPVGRGQLRRGWMVTAELCWSRVIAGSLIFSKEAPDILWALGRCLGRIGGLPEKLVWDREAAIGPGGRPSDAFAGFCGRLEVGWVILERGDAQAKGALERSNRGSISADDAPSVHEPGTSSWGGPSPGDSPCCWVGRDPAQQHRFPAGSLRERSGVTEYHETTNRATLAMRTERPHRSRQRAPQA
jgi:hypothetical protein